MSRPVAVLVSETGTKRYVDVHELQSGFVLVEWQGRLISASLEDGYIRSYLAMSGKWRLTQASLDRLRAESGR